MSWDNSVLVVEEKTKAVILSKHKETDFLSGLQNLSELTEEECSMDSLVYKGKEEELPPKYTSVLNLLFTGKKCSSHTPVQSVKEQDKPTEDLCNVQSTSHRCVFQCICPTLQDALEQPKMPHDSCEQDAP